MTSQILHIKNMVCRRCVMTVEDICQDLGINDAKVSLGSVTFGSEHDADTICKFNERLRAVGFESLKSHELVVLEKIKTAIRFYARHYEDSDRRKLSAHIEDSVKLDFRYASRLFSMLEGRTLQGYLMLQRIEYVKELLYDKQMTLAEIADAVGFSSVAHLSRAFKKSQGMTISEFRDAGVRTPIDEI